MTKPPPRPLCRTAYAVVGLAGDSSGCSARSAYPSSTAPWGGRLAATPAGLSLAEDARPLLAYAQAARAAARAQPTEHTVR